MQSADLALELRGLVKQTTESLDVIIQRIASVGHGGGLQS
jgi:hypothetical protein